MNEAYFQQLAIQAWNMKPFVDERFPPSRYYRFLRVLAANVKPSLSVELGVCGGGGSLHLALGWSRGTVVGVENGDGSSWERENWARVARICPNWVLWKGDSVDSAPEIAKEYGQVDVLFIDTVHTFERTVKEWEAWEPFMAERAVICLDDLFRPEMEGLWEWIPWQKARLDEMHDGAECGGGFGVAWR